jgi:hypothetical protein
MANIGYVSGPAVMAQYADFLLQGPNDEISNDLQYVSDNTRWKASPCPYRQPTQYS